MRIRTLACMGLAVVLLAGCKKESDEMTTPLHRAAEYRHVNEVRVLVEQGADVNARDFSGRTPLHLAARWDRTETVAFLLRCGADINAQDKWGYSVLQRALQNYRGSDAADFLISSGADVTTRSQNGETALHGAARLGRLDLVSRIVAKGVNVNATARDGTTPLLCAIIPAPDTARYHVYLVDHERLKVIRFLIAQSANVNTMNSYGDTPLSYAVTCLDLELAQLLVDKGAKLSRATLPDRNLAVFAMERNHLELARFLVALGADMKLHLAAYVGDLEKANTLIDGGADINARNDEGQTPLHMAARGGQREVAKLLINKGADVNAQDQTGWTPLHDAARRGDADVAQVLIAQGAAVNAKTMRDDLSEYRHRYSYHSRAELGTTPLHVAVEWPEVVKVLIANGADVNAKMEYGGAPIYRALLEGDRQVVDMLISAGGDVTLHYPAYRGNVEKVRQLIDAGADLEGRLDGYTPVHLAVLGGHADVVELLASSGADVNAKYRRDHYAKPDQAPLHDAASLGDLDVARILIARGADVNAKDDWDRTALHDAVYSGNTNVAELLLSHGADANAEGDDHKTPLDYAQEAGFVDIVHLLGGDTARASTGPYKIAITDPNAIQSFLGRRLPVDNVWIPSEAQLEEFEVALRRYVRERIALWTATGGTPMYSRRFHREYAGVISRGRTYIVCNLCHTDPKVQPPTNRFSGRFDTGWGIAEAVFDIPRLNIQARVIMQTGRY